MEVFYARWRTIISYTNGTDVRRILLSNHLPRKQKKKETHAKNK